MTMQEIEAIKKRSEAKPQKVFKYNVETRIQKELYKKKIVTFQQYRIVGKDYASQWFDRYNEMVKFYDTLDEN